MRARERGQSISARAHDGTCTGKGHRELLHDFLQSFDDSNFILFLKQNRCAQKSGQRLPSRHESLFLADLAFHGTSIGGGVAMPSQNSVATERKRKPRPNTPH